MPDRDCMVFCSWMENSGHTSVPFLPWNLWEENTLKAISGDRVYVLSINGCSVPCSNGIHQIRVKGNLGHFVHTLTGVKPHYFCGWTANMLTGAMIAYSAELDFIYKEQDCLAFGPWIDQMYEDIGNAGCVFGDFPEFFCAQSLMLVKHEFIPKFVALWLASPRENTTFGTPELKLSEMQKAHPDLFTRLSFGYDRIRPFNVSDPVFYLQHLRPDDIQILRDANLIT